MDLNKYSINHLKIFLIIFIILNFSIYHSSGITIGDYPYTKRLNNGNYLIASSTNIGIVDSTLNNEINNINISPQAYNSRDDTYSTIAEQFLPKDDEYIVAILKQNIYIFSKQGILLKNQYISIINQNLVYSIIPYDHSENEYYFVIIFPGKTNNINDNYDTLYFRNYIFNSSTKELIFNSDKSFIIKDSGNNPINFFNSVSCKLMLDKNNKGVIHCIYGNYNQLISAKFDINTFNTIDELPIHIFFSPLKICKIEVIPGDRKNAIVCNYHDGSNFVCRTYNILTNEFGQENVIGNNICNTYPSSLMIEYFYETEEIVAGCNGYHKQLTLGRFSKDLSFQTLGTIEDSLPEVNNIGNGIARTNIIFPSDHNQYSVLTGVVCSSCSQTSFFEILDSVQVNVINTLPQELECGEDYFNYEQNACISEVPPGFYCNNTEKKTIDKCHVNCYTCDKGPTNQNNTCLTCKSTGTQFFDLGNCTDICINGYFTENNVKICKCSSNITCKYCSVESKEYNLCESCNNEDGYYPKKDDLNNQNSFYNCYNSSSISEGYFLNTQNKQYEPCYYTCKNCEALGDQNDNKCTECKSEYPLKDIQNDNNCYPACSNYYYFDDGNQFKCTNDINCPTGYKKIEQKKKCIKYCKNDYQYQFEYNNYCYQNCPEDTIIWDNENKLCALKCESFNKYYNYAQTECIDTIPLGYYCNDEALRTIEKCHDNCETCEEGPINDNNNCLTCRNSGKKYFDLGNCTDICINGDFTDNSILKCKCSTDIKCFYCSNGSKQYGLCDSCNNGYYPKLNDSTNKENYINCYNSETILEGYYLNLTNNQYENCYPSCKNCVELGNDIDNKCLECQNGFSFILNNNNIMNCYEDCSGYYYFDSDYNYHCNENGICPTNYKLIFDKNKCIDNCVNDKIYNYTYEYENVCFEKCPDNTHISNENDKLCEADLFCEHYYNYEHTDCLDTIPEGFYCNSTELKTIDKCHDNCKTCEKGPTNDNNNCLTCRNSGKIYFDLGNCTDNCINGNFIDENDSLLKCKCSTDNKCHYCGIDGNCEKCNFERGFYPKIDDNRNDGYFNCYKNPEGYYLNNEVYDNCYSSCKYCSGSGSIQNNNCLECNVNYDFKQDFDDDKNCYENCRYNYYYDPNNNNIHICTGENNCPANYNKYIPNKKRCIDDCRNDNTYQYEYNNECLIECPDETHTTDDNLYKCIDNLNCEKKENRYYNYYKTECIETIPNGFYCNDTQNKTIDKCHDNCETCLEGPTNDNNNCLTCKNSVTIYFDLGNCRANCINDYFIDENDSILKCKCSTDEKCHYCNETSKYYNQCVKCNYEKGYYTKINDDTNIAPYFNCYKNPEGYYLNNQIYEPCYSSCKYCYGIGNINDNKCLECNTNYIFKNDFDNDTNCYEKCPYNYYYDSENIYKCTEGNNCPENFNKFISAKKRCIDECKKYNNFKYEYENNCYDNCPEGTEKSGNNTYLCEKIPEIVKDEETCKLVEDNLNFYQKEITKEYIYYLTLDYIKQFGYSNDYVSKYDNFLYKIYIYKNFTCIIKTVEEAPQIDFGECYNKVKSFYKIDDDLIIVIINVIGEEKAKPSLKYIFSNPKTAEILNITEICANEKIIIQEDVNSLIKELDDQKEEYILHLTKQGIDVFNISDEFYNDMCYHFESPNEKDIPLRERIAAIFPNITLCEPGCESKGVDLEKMKAKCICAFSDFMNNDLMDNFYGQAISEFMSILSSFNIFVVQCVKDIFVKEHFVKCIGGIFILSLLLGEIICILIYLKNGLYNIRKHIFALSESFCLYIKKNPIINSPPIKVNNKSETSTRGSKKDKNKKDSNKKDQNKKNQKKKEENRKEENKKEKNKKDIIKKGENKFRRVKTEQNKKVQFKKDRNIKNKITIENSENVMIFKNNIKKSNFSKAPRILTSKKITSFNTLNFETKKKLSLNLKGIKFNNSQINTDRELIENNEYLTVIQEYLSPSFDERDFDDVIDLDKRKFCEYFWEQFKTNQIFINTFCIVEILRPKSLKFLILIITIELYFVINALFYTEEYLIELFYSTDKEEFFSFIPRRFNAFIYTSAVSGIISYLIGCFFVDEEKIKRTFRRDRNDSVKLKYDLSLITKDIKSKFTFLVCSSLILSILSFIYISCFNIVYPYIRKEWIKSSIFIVLLMQFINLFMTFAETCLRYLAIRFNSEKTFRLYLLLA